VNWAGGEASFVSPPARIYELGVCLPSEVVVIFGDGIWDLCVCWYAEPVGRSRASAVYAEAAESVRAAPFSPVRATRSRVS